MKKDSVCRSVVLQNRRGLHARVAARIVKEMARFDADVTVGLNDTHVTATSIMDLLLLAASCDTEIIISATGSQAEEAVACMVEMVDNKFDED